ncbi:magnesium transporter CorA family protein [Amnibacterium kyonggiense]|uniref:Magnesium transporter n=1 Tax=Amnibacterium kyonggiense TaxID=595671 RepID=A0A4R7FEQ8_9MICO|nr:magnesium transporter CorA family protein [Amnibacterium kyonggiense]TDS74483.1 magnesium transporter [Amnibacterium kyonggiense]
MSDPAPPAVRPASGDPQQPGPAAASVSEAVPPKCPTRTRLYRGGALAAEGFPAEAISDHLAADDGSFVWLDLFDPDAADLQIVTDEFGLHPLAVEDAVQDHQRSKLDRYRTHLFANVYAVRFDAASDELRTSELSAFITDRALITVRKAEWDVDALVARWDAERDLVGSGVGFLVHGFIDAVVDGQYQAVEQISDASEELEDAMFDARRRQEIRRRGFELRKSLGKLRRVVAPMREVVARLARTDEDHHVAGDRLGPYFQDVQDHVVQTTDAIEAQHELVSSILDTNQNEQGNDLNEITKKLASWAAIIAVPTAVTGFYGQNVPYPGFSKEWGFVTSCAVIVGLGGGIWTILRRRGWL